MSTDITIASNLRELMSSQMSKQESREQAISELTYISTKGKRFRAGDTKLPDELNVVLLTAGYAKAYYDAPWSPEGGSSVACFNVGLQEITTPNATSPAKQSESCNGCQWNEFESATLGKGKACKDS